MKLFPSQAIIIFLTVLLLCNIHVPLVHSLFLCSQHDQSSLLQLKHTLVFDWDGSSSFDSWKSSSDCCVWVGVTCSPRGHVLHLDLSGQSISGGLEDPNSTLFDLHHLQSLDLSNNYFNGGQIPSGIRKLVNLLHLDLSHSIFGGQVPIDISNLSSLRSLNLTGSSELKLENPKFSELINNLTNLVELKLEGVNMSTDNHWSHALSSSLPNLQVLILSDCSLSGPIDLKLRNLTSIDLSDNNLSTSLANILANFTSLTSLRLINCGLYGEIPPTIFRTSSLQSLHLSNNKLLSGTLPESIGNMTALEILFIYNCSFSGSIDHIHWENLKSLAYLLMGDNELNGSIPLSLFSLPRMHHLDLSSNQFSGELGEVDVAIFVGLYLSENKLEGSIPTLILNHGSLVELFLSHNNFNGTIDLTHLFQNIPNISILDLSFNHLSIIQTWSGVKQSSVPQLFILNLASCNLKTFPSVLKNKSRLSGLDLSENNISGQVPNWLWKLTLTRIDLSHNSLTSLETLLPNQSSSLQILNLKFNLLQGHIPLEFGNYFPSIHFLSLSSNNFKGSIPLSICNISPYFEVVIDLSNNSLSGAIPHCLLAMELGVLNLKRNNSSGSIPNTFTGNCTLQTLDLSENQLRGTVPESIVNCKSLKVLDLGNNQLNGGFPCWLMHVSNLTVLILRSNRFYGNIRCALSNGSTNGWSKLQIIDIAANNFHGQLPHKSFTFWTTMMMQIHTAQPKTDSLSHGYYYHDGVTIVNKGIAMVFVKILIFFNAIDFSCNHFEGLIPESIGNLRSLRALNLSHNHFNGSIPPSIGNLKAMESLDLANNILSGVIPEQLASLTSLSYLNLSFNHLVGKIPTSTQLQSFPEGSYIGNEGLYGPPLRINCVNNCDIHEAALDPSSADEEEEVDWQVICIEMGYLAGLASVIGSLMLLKRWTACFFERVDIVMFKVFPSLGQHKRKHGRRVHRTSMMKRRQ